MAKPLLVLFDGNALVHRAFHALPPLAVTRTGEPTGAVYGFAQMVLKVLAELKPAYCAVAFDSVGPTFRHLQYEKYKETRKPAPEELRRQFPRVRELVQAFHLPIYEAQGYEADDVLGALSRQASEQGMEVLIVTGDQDTMQLVSPQVRVLLPKPQRPFSDTIVYDLDMVRQRYGLEPGQVPDLKGLKGDTSDNIPGVPGVGEKTALKLLHQFGTVEGIYEHIHEVAPARLQESLRQHRDIAFQSKALATIATQLPLALDMEACRLGPYDRERVTELFRELDFNRLLPRLPQVSQAAAIPVQPPEGRDYGIITTTQALEEALAQARAAPALAIDVETAGGEGRDARDARYAELVGISMSIRPGQAWYIPVGHLGASQLPLPQVLDGLRPLLEDPRLPKVAHNGKYEMTVLGRYGVPLKPLAFDTMIAAYLLGEKALGLKALAFSRLGVEMTPIAALIGTGAKQISMAQVPVEAAADYACADADLALRLRDMLEAELRREGLEGLFADVEMPLLPVLFTMERHGVALDTEHLRHLSQDYGEKLAHLEAQIYAAVGHEFNVNSTPQLRAVLFEELGLPRARRTKTGYSTEAAVLEELRGAHDVIDLLLEYRQLSKLKSTYIDALPALIDPGTGRLHTSFNQTGTATGRLSSSAPNLQNIPIRTEEGRQVRRAFIAPPGHLLLGADYSQIDLRALAHLSGDPGLVAAFLRDEDIHRATAAQVFGVALGEVTSDMRRVAKTVNFGVIYGMSEFGLEQATGLSRQEAAAFIQAYFQRYPGVWEYLEATKAAARERGYVQTLLGRRRYVPEINHSNAQVRAAAERMAINMPVQGTSADIIKVAMIDLHRRMGGRGLRSKMTLQVHDELVFEVPEGEVEEMQALVAERMPRALELKVPLKVGLKVGRHWGEME